MTRTEVVLPEFTRLIWSSEDARLFWEPRISRIGGYFLEREKLSCLNGRSMITNVSPDRLPDLIKWADENGLALLTLGIGATTGFYRSSQADYVKGQPWDLRVAVTPVEKIQSFLESYRSKDDRSIGNLLSYPPCCTRFFKQYWVDERFLDTTWPMAQASDGTKDVTIVGGYNECNILLRWAGVRAVPHLPCSFNCNRTRLFADSFNDMDREEYKWILELLSMPVEWSALHGIARIKTPLFEVSTRTDHTDEKYVVRVMGKHRPVGSARGLVFPFLENQKSCSEPEQDSALWSDNGFSSRRAMDEAHSVIVEVAESLCHPGIIYDLGCGNGLLLEKLRVLFPDTHLYGIDNVEKKWEGSSLFIKKDIKDVNIGPRSAVAFISINRFDEEIGIHDTVNQFVELIVYSYDGRVLPTGFGSWDSVISISRGQTSAALYRKRYDTA